MTIFRHNFRVRYAETDRMGVSYYAHYLVWFEMGRAEYFRDLGVSYTSYEEEGMFLPVIEAFARYLAPTTYDDPLTIEVIVSAVGRSSIKFEYRILHAETERKVAEGYTVHAFVDRSHKPVRVPDEIKHKISLQVFEPA
jgi:acyl-CoA thioester hydrolase